MPENKRVKLRPGRRDFQLTLAGLFYLCVLVAVAVAAVNTQRGLLFVMFGLMVGGLFASVGVSRRTISAVRVRREMPERVFANRVVYLGYLLTHVRRRGAAMGLELTEISPPAELQTAGVGWPWLPPGSWVKSGSPFLARRRGRYRVSGLRLATRFPFGLLRAHRDFPQAAALVVWPALGRLRKELLAGGAAEVSDAAPSQRRSGADEFFGLREYRQGDNPRWIHWKRSAATGSPIVREMSKPLPDVLYVLLDTQLADASQAQRRLRERLISFAATLIDHAFRRQYRVGLAAAYSDRAVVVPAGAGRGRRSALLDVLADVDDNADRSFSKLLQAVRPGLLRHAHVVVVGADRKRLVGLQGVRATCRRLTVVTPEELPDLFDDDPSAALEPAGEAT